MQKPQKCMKGQISLVNLFVVFLVIIIYIGGLLPVILDTIAQFKSDYPSTDAITLLFMDMLPWIILALILLSAVAYAIPQREGGGGYGGGY